MDPEIQEGWTEEVTLKIIKDAKGVPLSSGPPYFPRLDQSNDEKEQWPSIFRPCRQVAVARPMSAQMPSQQQPLDHTSSRGSTGGSVIVVAVGPYHRDGHQRSVSRPPLITYEKKCAIVEFLARPEFGLDIADFLRWARDNDARARRYYELDSLTMGREELAKMHLLDGCLVLFAVFLLRKSSAREDQLRPDPFCSATDPSLLRKSSVRVSPTTGSSSEPARTSGRGKRAEDFTYLTAEISQHMKQTRLDLLLLGNQIPFFVLAELHRRLAGTFFLGIEPNNIQELALSCFHDIRPSGFIKQVAGEVSFPETVHHLLHLFHWSRVPPGKHDVDDDSPPLVGEPESNLGCATWFEDSLIGLSTHAAAPGALHMDFRWSMLGARGVLRLPALRIHGYSALVFHNLIAFEQRYLRCGFGATTYCICMARLLQSEADAKLLRRNRILEHTHETDEEIVALFKDLAEEYRHASYSRDLLDLCKNVEAHQRSTAARAAKSVVLQCFPRQTVTFFVILGALISIATLVNTVFAVYRFYHPVKQQCNACMGNT